MKRNGCSSKDNRWQIGCPPKKQSQASNQTPTVLCYIQMTSLSPALSIQTPSIEFFSHAVSLPEKERDARVKNGFVYFYLWPRSCCSLPLLFHFYMDSIVKRLPAAQAVTLSGAVLLGLLALKYNDRAIFSEKPDDRIPRTPGTQPLVGDLFTMIAAKNRMYDYLTECFENLNTLTMYVCERKRRVVKQ